METVLGLSMTSTGIGWVLRDGSDVDPVAFDGGAGGLASDFVAETTGDDEISLHTSAVRSAKAIADSIGHPLKSIHLTWSDDVSAKAPLLT